MSQPDPHGAAPATAGSAPAAGGRGRRKWVMLSVILGAAIVPVLLMDRGTGPTPLLPAVPMPADEPDVYFESPEVTQYRDDGSLEYELTADLASHFTQASLTRLTQPRLSLHATGHPPWQASAASGTLQRPLVGTPDQGVAEETVRLEDDVVLVQTLSNDTVVRLTTQSLRLYPRRQYAETDQDVMIESVFGRTTASGLKGDLRAGLLELISAGEHRVRTVLRPDQFK